MRRGYKFDEINTVLRERNDDFLINVAVISLAAQNQVDCEHMLKLIEEAAAKL